MHCAASRTVSASRRGRGQRTSPTKRQPKSLPNAHSHITRFTFMAACQPCAFFIDVGCGQMQLVVTRHFGAQFIIQEFPWWRIGAAGSDSALR